MLESIWSNLVYGRNVLISFLLISRYAYGVLLIVPMFNQPKIVGQKVFAWLEVIHFGKLFDKIRPCLISGIYGFLFLYQGLMDGIKSALNKGKENEEMGTELTRIDIIKCIQSEKVRFRGVNLSGIDLSKLVHTQCIFFVFNNCHRYIDGHKVFRYAVTFTSQIHHCFY